jgi:hypothetical protein
MTLTEEEKWKSLTEAQGLLSSSLLVLKNATNDVEKKTENLLLLLNAGITLEMFEGSEVTENSQEEGTNTSSLGEMVWHRGKYNGKTLDYIREDRPDYITWVCEAWADRDIRDKVRAYADEFGIAYRVD